jgi:hypothetical protein
MRAIDHSVKIIEVGRLWLEFVMPQGAGVFAGGGGSSFALRKALYFFHQDGPARSVLLNAAFDL